LAATKYSELNFDHDARILATGMETLTPCPLLADLAFGNAAGLHCSLHLLDEVAMIFILEE
jgi:hypothetical protein